LLLPRFWLNPAFQHPTSTALLLRATLASSLLVIIPSLYSHAYYLRRGFEKEKEKKEKLHGLPTDLLGLPCNLSSVLTHFGLNQTFRIRLDYVESRTWATERRRAEERNFANPMPIRRSRMKGSCAWLS
jgi:hypothetical protein